VAATAIAVLARNRRSLDMMRTAIERAGVACSPSKVDRRASEMDFHRFERDKHRVFGRTLHQPMLLEFPDVGVDV
jgi:hypothetical protein